ncbi:hypothetical protein [Microbacterium sp.]|uniref:hypothetical protein n=1 Tax=Microbacterium sp. TaxID=51671 RepID=UPI0039E6BA1E
MNIEALNLRIARVEKAAIVRSLTGQYRQEHDDELRALYALRRAIWPTATPETDGLTDRQRDGFACVVCGVEPMVSRPVGFGAHGQLFACAEDHAALLLGEGENDD